MKLSDFGHSTFLGMAIGIAVTVWAFHWQEKPVVPELHAPEIRIDEHTLVAERVPDAPIPEPIKTTAKKLKTSVARAGSVTIENAKPTLKLDWGLLDTPTGYRMIFHTDDGLITEGVDIPVKTLTRDVYPKWTVGVLVPFDYPRGVGPIIERHFGRVSVGAAAAKLGDRGWTGFATASVSW